MCDPCDEAFLFIPILTLCPWPWPLTYMFKNFSLCHDFWTIRGRTFMFGMHTQLMKPFQWHQGHWFCNLDHDLYTKSSQFELCCRRGHLCFTCTLRVRLSYYRYSLWQDLSVGTNSFDPVTVNLTFDILLEKKLNLGLNFWTKTDRALIFLLCPPLKKEGILLCTCRSVCRSVGRYVGSP